MVWLFFIEAKAALPISAICDSGKRISCFRPVGEVAQAVIRIKVIRATSAFLMSRLHCMCCCFILGARGYDGNKAL